MGLFLVVHINIQTTLRNHPRTHFVFLMWLHAFNQYSEGKIPGG